VSTGGAGTGGRTGGSGTGGYGTVTLGGGGNSNVTYSGVPVDDAGVDAGPAPVTACQADAGPAEACTLPPSYCADADWLVFYASATCVDGLCQYERRALYCVCQNDGCKPGITL
jgi:hypothetical protein